MRRAWLAALLAGCAARPGGPAPPAAVTAPPVIYQVFPRSLADSDGDGVGDLRGITAHLDDLQDGRPGGVDLGVNALWLTPVHPSPSYHGYDVTDYLDIHPDFGSLADMDALLQGCNQRGVRVIMDLVVNHTSREHPWFRAALEPSDPHRAWYLFREDNPGWPPPWNPSGRTWHAAPAGGHYFGLFFHGMPDLDHRSAAVRDEVVRIMAFWLGRGVDGFRVDAARHLVEGAGGVLADAPENVRYLAFLRTQAQRLRPGAIFLAELWTDAEHQRPYRDTGALLTDFDLAGAVEAALLSWRPAPLLSYARARRNAGLTWDAAATFLSNHDMPRLRDRLFSDAAVIAAHAILLTLPGTPILYYGDEVAMAAGTGEGDPRWRTPMAWTPAGGFTTGTPWLAPSPGGVEHNVAAQRGQPGSVLESVRALLALRAHAALAADAGADITDEGGSLVRIMRHAPSADIWTVVNL